MRLILILNLAFLLMVSSVVSGAENPQVHVASKPSWLGSYAKYDKKPNSRTIKDGFFYELSDYQINVDQKQVYHHYIRDIISANGIQDGSQVSVDFNPSYERLDFHEIIVWRDGKPQNRLNLSDFKLLADEQDFSRFIYEGSYSANLILKDIRKGDRIEYSFTITGANPVLNNKFCRFIYLQGDKTVAHQYISIIAPQSRKLNMKFFNQAAKPSVTENQGLRRYVWEDFLVEPVIEEENEPTWYNSYNYVEITEYNSWAEVAAWASQVNPIADNIHGELADLVKKLKTRYGTDKIGYFREATRVVQNDVRYMGIEIGEYSHRANRPEKVYNQRYGDCKDKSLLLVSMLNANGIDAHMVLVNTDLGDKVERCLPTATAFDHAVVVATINNKQVWVDATIANQGGDGLDIYFPAYGKGLILEPDAVGLSNIPVTPIGKVNCEEVYTVKDDSSKVNLTVKTTYTLNQADRERDKLESSSIAETEKSYLDYYSKIYSKVESADSLKVLDDIHKNQLTTIESYSITDFFKRDSLTGKQNVDFYANYIGDLLPSISNRSKSPVAVDYPYAIDFTTKVIMSNGWNIDDRRNAIDRDAYRFRSHYYALGDTLLLNYNFAYLKDFVAANKLDEFKKDIEDLKDKDGLSYGISYGTSNAPFRLNLWLFLGLVGLAAGSAFLGYNIYTTETSAIVFSRGAGFVPLGGWLVLVLIGLLLSPLIDLYELTDKGYLSISKWYLLNHGSRGLWYKTGLVYEAAGYVFKGCYSIFCLILLLNRRDILPQYIIGFYIANVIFFILDYVLAIGLKSDGSQIGEGIVRSIIFAGIWIAYFKKSTRVEDTFIVPYPHGNYSHE